jgi:hypothetical protein
MSEHYMIIDLLTTRNGYRGATVSGDALCCIQGRTRGDHAVAQSHARNGPDDPVAALKERAEQRRRSRGAEYRRLEEALLPACSKQASVK